MPTTPYENGTDEETPLLLEDGRKRFYSGNDADLDFDARYKKWKAAVTQKFRRSANQEGKPALLVTFFDSVDGARDVIERKAAKHDSANLHDATFMTPEEFQLQVKDVQKAIEQGVHPKMIATGSSGSYFARVLNTSKLTNFDPTAATESQSTVIVAVFKPKDEEPYGNLNPKRQFLRKYFWWAMGRPCLIPNFSYLSEVGASYLDTRLCLHMVPRTELVELSTPSFHYAFSDRKAFENEGKPLPPKVGSYQTFLTGYVNASDFLRKHPWPSRSRSEALMLRDFEDESRAHQVSRKKQKARIRNCGIALKRILLCRPTPAELALEEEHNDWRRQQVQTENIRSTPVKPSDEFSWTPKRMEQFRRQLEKLVVLDYLMRNTDRGLDNFMVKHDKITDQVTIGAIDNSLSFPIKHPNEIRQYPFGWLFLPTDLIGLPFSEETREQLLPILNDPVWWQETVQGLRQIFQRDLYFDESKFQKQMSVLRGQGWNLVQCLRNEEEGPLDLCAMEKKFIRQEIVDVATDALEVVDGAKVPIDAQGQVSVETLRSLRRQHDASLAKQSKGKKGIACPPPERERVLSERRPIGARASFSYRLLLNSSASDDVVESFKPIAYLAPKQNEETNGAHPQSLPGTSLMQEVFAKGNDDSRARPDIESNSPRRPRGHSRMFSAQEPLSFLRRKDSDTTDTAEVDDILGQTGMQVLEKLDRERKQKKKFNVFKSSRPRSSTISTAAVAPFPDRGAREDSRSQPEAPVERYSDHMDLASSIMSDPGLCVEQAAGKAGQRGRMTRHTSGMSSSTHDLYGEEDVLSEEDETGDGVTSNRSRRYQPDDKYAMEPGPSIDSIVSSVQDSSSSKDVEHHRAESSTRFTPHLPHASAIGSTEYSRDSMSPSQNAGKSPSDKGTVRVILETMSSETRQPWLKWI